MSVFEIMDTFFQYPRWCVIITDTKYFYKIFSGSNKKMTLRKDNNK